MKNGMIPSMGCGPLRTNPLSQNSRSETSSGRNGLNLTLRTSNYGSIVIGSGSKALNPASVAIGLNCSAGSGNVGTGSSVGMGAVAIGSGNSVTNTYGNGGVAIGSGNTCNGENGSVVVGRTCQALSTGDTSSIVIGQNVSATTSADKAIVIGWYTDSYAKLAHSIGFNVSNRRPCSVAMANGSISAFGDSQFNFGVLSGKTITNSFVALTSNSEVSTTNPILILGNRLNSGTINIHGIKSDGSASAHYYRQFSFKNLYKTVLSVDITNNVLNFSTNHGFSTGDVIRVTTTSAAPGGITMGAIYYALAVSLTSISVHTGSSPDGSNIVDITSVGAGTIYVSGSKLAYTPVMIGNDLPSGTSLSITCVTVPRLTDFTPNLYDYIEIAVAGTSGDTWRWTASFSLAETIIGA